MQILKQRHARGMFVVRPELDRILEPEQIDGVRTSLREAIAKGYSDIGLDLAGVRQVGDTFINMLMGELQPFSRQGGAMCLFNLEAELRNALTETVIGHVADILADEPEAAVEKTELQKYREANATLREVFRRAETQSDSKQRQSVTPDSPETAQQSPPAAEAESTSEKADRDAVPSTANRRRSGGRRPYGTTDAEAEVLRVMIEMRENNVSFQKIAEELNRAGYSNQSGRPWAKGNVYTVLKNNTLKS